MSTQNYFGSEMSDKKYSSRRTKKFASVSLFVCVLMLVVSAFQAMSGVASAASSKPFEQAYAEHGENAFDFENIKTRDFEANKKRWGFTIDDTWKPVYMENNDFNDKWGDTYYKSGSTKWDFAISIQQVFLRNVLDSNLYAFAYRVVLSPNNSTEHYGFLNLGTRGTQWINRRQTTSVQLRSGTTLSDWEPKNKPNNSSGSFGIGMDSTGPSLGATIDYNHSELNIISRSSTGNNYYETEYDYDRGGWDWFWGVASDYMKHDVVSFGFFTFTTTGTAWVDIVHRGTFESIGGLTSWKITFTGSF